MDAVFNIKRFGNLIRRETLYSWKVFLYIVLGLVAYFVMAKLLDSMWQLQVIALLPPAGIAFVICGTPFINKNLNKVNFIPFLTIPASNFEKWLLLWIKSVIIMPILVIGTIYLLNYISPTLIIDRMFEGRISQQIYAVLVCQSIFFLGYTYFKERALVKSIIAIVVLFIFINLISRLIISQFYPEIASVRNSFDILYILNYDGFYDRVAKTYIETGTTTIYQVCLWIVKLIFPLGLWIVSYFRLRETEK